jgi:hypothetical protein
MALRKVGATTGSTDNKHKYVGDESSIANSGITSACLALIENVIEGEH